MEELGNLDDWYEHLDECVNKRILSFLDILLAGSLFFFVCKYVHMFSFVVLYT